MRGVRAGVTLWGFLLLGFMAAFALQLYSNCCEGTDLEKASELWGVPLAVFAFAWGQFFLALGKAEDVFRELDTHMVAHWNDLSEEGKALDGMLWIDHWRSAPELCIGVYVYGAVYIALIAVYLYLLIAHDAVTPGFAVMYGVITLAVGNIWGKFFDRSVEMRVKRFPGLLKEFKSTQETAASAAT